VKCFHAWTVSALKAISLKSETPMLAKTHEGATLSGIIDLLIETENGYWIVDHKTDIKTNDEQFKKHLPQLLAYAQYTKLDKPILGVAVNWVREGKVSCLSYL
jgi:ATP-dependent exoDNAse (exonuclease V) beta subunit